jgi:hypothetical protein
VIFLRDHRKSSPRQFSTRKKMSRKLVPLRIASEELGTSVRTTERRIENPPPGFPAVIRIGKRRYFDFDQLESFKATLLDTAMAAKKPVQSADACAEAV